MSNTQLVVGYLCAIVITSMFVWIGVALHMAYTKLDVMLATSEKLRGHYGSRTYKARWPMGEIDCLIGGSLQLLSFPGFYLRRGEL